MENEEFFLSIDGRLISGHSFLEVVNPADGRIFARAPDASRSQLDDAVVAARRAFPAWAALPIGDRKSLLNKIGEVILDHVDLLKRLLTREQGKPHADAEWEVRGAAAWCQGSAAPELPTVLHENSAERHSVTRRVPIGVVGAIAPWNFPLILAVWKVAPALLAGNTVVLKPSPYTPLTTLRFGELLQRVLPPGVVNVVSGGDDLGPWMSSHPGIDKISFTGSTVTGKKVMMSAASNLKRLTLELGGNDAAIVLPDVQVEKIVPELFWAAFRNTGQVCVAAKRLFVHSAIYDAVAKGLVAYSRRVKIGDGSEPGVELGPIQNRRQYCRVLELIEGAKAAGLRFLTGGTADERSGYFVPVTLIDNPPDKAAVVTEEAFGPVLPLLRFDDIDEVVRRANDSLYGLAASVWSGNEETARAVGERLRCGTVWINEAQYVSPFATFGGHGQSGLGVENGVDGLIEYTNAQTISTRRQVG
jgi:acyl-CoA reductase-like NAD-dependent aldehyde dehydrogenase